MQFLIGLFLCLFALSAQAQTYGPGQRATPGTLTRPGQIIAGGGVIVVPVCATDPSIPVTATTSCAGSFTANCGNGPLQVLNNNGALTFTAPLNDGSCIIQSKNTASAGAITFSGFTVKSSPGDALTTTSTNVFAISVWRINGVSGYNVTAQQ